MGVRVPRLVSAFSPKAVAEAPNFRSQINFCPWCGKELQFLESEETKKPHARAAKAGRR
jgi:hypothetical protein